MNVAAISLLTSTYQAYEVWIEYSPVQPYTQAQGEKNLWEKVYQTAIPNKSPSEFIQCQFFMFDKRENFPSSQKSLTLKTKGRILPYRSHRKQWQSHQGTRHRCK